MFYVLKEINQQTMLILCLILNGIVQTTFRGFLRMITHL